MCMCMFICMCTDICLSRTKHEHIVVLLPVMQPSMSFKKLFDDWWMIDFWMQMSQLGHL